MNTGRGDFGAVVTPEGHILVAGTKCVRVCVHAFARACVCVCQSLSLDYFSHTHTHTHTHIAAAGGETRDPSDDEYRLVATDSVEMYNMTSGEWMKMPSLPVAKFR